MFSKYIRFLIKEYLFTFFSIAFVTTYWVSSRKLTFISLRYPLVISIIVTIMIIWNLILSVKEFREIYKADGDGIKKWDCTLELTKEKLGAIGATILYVILIPIIGYCVSTVLYLACMTFFLGERNLVKVITFSIVMTGLMYLIFKVGLNIRLPTGLMI